MERKKFKIYWFIITITIGFLIGISIIFGEIIISAGVVVIGLILLYALKSRVKQVIEDERVYRISEKASRRTIQTVGTTTALLGLIIIVLSRSGYLDLSEVGFSLAYFATFLLLVYMIFYGYYSRIMGE